MARRSVKQQRQQLLLEKIKSDPFLTDDELAQIFNVSVPTIRFDRAELGVGEYRQRIKDMAISALERPSVTFNNPLGDLVDLNLFSDGISVFAPDQSMTFGNSKVVMGCYIYAFAETLAMAVIDAEVALVEVANIKYKQPVIAGSRLVAKSEVKRVKEDEYTVWVKIRHNMVEVFRCKLILKIIKDNIEN